MHDEMRADHDHGHCAHAAHQHARAPDALAQAEAACRDRGVRLTAIRRQVLETLYSTHRPLGAYDIADRLTTSDGRRLAPITIYRALDFLMEQGLVHRLASRNAFVACPHAHGPRDLVAFLICEVCDGVDEVSSPQVSDALSDLVRTQRFTPTQQVLEVAGRCAHCRGEAAHG